MKEMITGKSKGAQEAQAIINPETNELVVSNSESKKVTLKYCLKFLEDNEPDEKVKELVELKKEVHRLRIEAEMVMMRLLNKTSSKRSGSLK